MQFPTSAHLHVEAAVGKLEVSLLYLAQLALKRLFSSGAPKLATGISPVEGPVILDAVTIRRCVFCVHVNHRLQKVIDHALVPSEVGFQHRVP